MRLWTCLLLIIGSCTCQVAWADEAQCQQTLSLCRDYARAQDEQADHLKQSVKKLEDELAKDEPGVLGSVPWPLWVVVGGVAGYAAGRVLSK